MISIDTCDITLLVSCLNVELRMYNYWLMQPLHDHFKWVGWMALRGNTLLHAHMLTFTHVHMHTHSIHKHKNCHYNNYHSNCSRKDSCVVNQYCTLTGQMLIVTIWGKQLFRNNYVLTYYFIQWFGWWHWIDVLTCNRELWE